VRLRRDPASFVMPDSLSIPIGIRVNDRTLLTAIVRRETSTIDTGRRAILWFRPSHRSCVDDATINACISRPACALLLMGHNARLWTATHTVHFAHSSNS
jgi:hypothetical protein